MNNVFSLFTESFLHYQAYFIQKDKKIWIFGAIRGKKYNDNARYLFEFIHKNTNINAIWISKNKDVVKQLNESSYEAYHEDTKEARYYSARASVAIITHRGNRSKSDLPFHLFSKDTKIVQLWHGIPLKKVAYDDKIFSWKYDENSFKWRMKVLLKKVFFPFLSYVNEPALILALSKETKDIFSKAFRISHKNVVITGYPRNDVLVKSPEVNNKKLIYMPTFRGSIHSEFDLFSSYKFDIDLIENFLYNKNMSLDIKLHPFNEVSLELTKKVSMTKNIKFLENDSIYEILNEYDMLITDYSSIYFDYLLLNKPIIFTPFDKDIYLEKDREFYFDYDEVTPGPKAKDWEEVIEYIEKMDQDKFLYSKERDEIKNRFHMYQDSNSTQRVYEAILGIVE